MTAGQCDAYEVPGTKDFGEYLICGAGDGPDKLAANFGNTLYSLGRKPAAGAATGCKQPLTGVTCRLKECQSKLHSWPHGPIVTRGMYEGDPENKKAGLKEISFYDPSGGNSNAQEIEKKLVSSIDEVFHPMFFYEWDEIIDRNKGPAT